MPEAHRDEIAKLESLFAANPEGRIFTHLAEAYRKAGELDRARDVLETGLARHRDYPSAHVVMGRVLRGLGESAGAREAFRRVLDLDTHNLVAIRSLGELAEEAGDAAEALRYYERLVAMESGDPELTERVARLEEALRSQAPSVEPEPEPAEEPALLDFAGAGPAEEEAGTEHPLLDISSFGGADTGEAEGLDAADLTDALAALSAPDSPSTLDLDAVDLSFGGAPEQTAPEAEAPQEPVTAESWELGPEDGELDGDLVTETIADLYIQQGLFDRAVAVYRALIEARPADAGLVSKLEEAERLAAGGAALEAAEAAEAAEMPAGPQAEGPTEPEAETWTEPEPTEPADFEFFSETPEDLSELAESVETPPDLGLVTQESMHQEALQSFQQDESVGDSMEDYYRDVFSADEQPLVAEGAEPPSGEAQAEEPAAEAEQAQEPIEAELDREAGPEAVEAWTPTEGEWAPAEEEWTPAEEESEIPTPEEGGFAAWLEGTVPEEPMAEALPGMDAGEEPVAEMDEVPPAAVEGPAKEALQDSGTEASPVELPTSETSEVEPELESIEAAWTGGDASSGVEETPYAWREREEDATESPRTIRAYFGALLDWRPAGETAAAAEPDAAEPETAGSQDAVQDAWILPVDGAAAGTEPDEIDALFEPASETSAAEPGDELDELFGGAAAAETAQAEPAPAPAPAKAERQEPAEEDEEDLEMFRAWLQSLKH